MLKEEMRRTVISLRHRARLWEKRAATGHEQREGYAKGLTAYAYSQANLLYSLADTFEASWAEGASREDDETDEDDDLQAELDRARAEDDDEEASEEGARV